MTKAQIAGSPDAWADRSASSVAATTGTGYARRSLTVR